MACIINNGWALGCRDNTGGVQRILIKTHIPSQTYTYDINGEVLTGTTTETFYEVEQTSEAAEFKQDGQHSVENGTNFYNQTVSVVFHKYQAALRDLIYVLAQKEVTILVQDQNNNWFLIGEQNGANLTASTANVGKAYGDMNGATATFIVFFVITNL
jgi:hypothetical protein